MTLPALSVPRVAVRYGVALAVLLVSISGCAARGGHQRAGCAGVQRLFLPSADAGGSLAETTQGELSSDFDDAIKLADGSAEKLADIYEISRESQDEFALRSHSLADAAWNEGRFPEVVPVPGVDLERDEGIRADSSLEKLGKLKPAFVEGGTVTAGNSSPLNDGASMLLLGSEAAAERIGTAPLARVVSRAAHGVDPDVFGIAPVEAANVALAKAGIAWDDVDVVELNEAFASQSLACIKGWPDLDPAIAVAERNVGALLEAERVDVELDGAVLIGDRHDDGPDLADARGGLAHDFLLGGCG